MAALIKHVFPYKKLKSNHLNMLNPLNNVANIATNYSDTLHDINLRRIDL